MIARPRFSGQCPYCRQLGNQISGRIHAGIGARIRLLSSGHALNSKYALCFPKFLAVVAISCLGLGDDAGRGACMARRSPIYGKGDA